MSLQPEGCLLDGVYYQSCQLYSRHWIIKSKDDVVADVNGEGVIGKVNVLQPGCFHLIPMLVFGSNFSCTI